MTPALTFFIGLAMLVLFGWYFATDQGPRKRLLAMTLMLLLVVFSIATIWPPQKKIALGLDIQGGTSFLIRLVPGEKPVEERFLVRKKANLSVERVSNAGASYEKDGWVVHLRFDAEGAKQFGNITAANVHHRFAIVLDGIIQSAPVIQDAIYGGDAQ